MNTVPWPGMMPALDRLRRTQMVIKCSVCNEASYKVVDSETDVQDRSFVLLECQKCSRTIIVPEAEWKAQAGRMTGD